MFYNKNDWDTGGALPVPANPDAPYVRPLIEAAKAHRARGVAVGIAGLRGRLPGPRVLLTVLAVALASVALMATYAFLLMTWGVTTSSPALVAVLVAATLSSIAGFAFSAICGVLLLHLMNDPIQVVEIMIV